MGCKGYCDQGRKPCQLPEECDDDLGPAYGVLSAMAWTLVLWIVGAFTITLILNWHTL